jgi:hypothetical protein
VKKNSDVPLDGYHGLPRGAFQIENLHRQASAAFGTTDPGVWSTAVSIHQNAVDPHTSKPYTEQPLADVADGAVWLAAADCRSLAIKFSAATDERGAELEVAAAKHLTEAVDNIEHAGGILDEPLTGPDGEVTDGRRIHVTQQKDEELARQRSTEGDSRHTQREWAESWRVLAATLLGLLDILLLWKPLLNLSFESNSGTVFRWAIGGGLASLQVLGIEWAARVYVGAERLSTDRRGSVGDYNRLLKRGNADTGTAPDSAELTEADSQLAHAYRWLVVVAGFIAIIGGVRVAVLAKRAELQVYEAALFGVIIGLILGGLVIQMARLYCRGNLLGDRLEAEREALADVNGRLQHARGMVAGERENALAALATAEVLSAQAASIRNQTVADYWRAVQLAWTWFGLPHGDLDRVDFAREALPVVTETDAHRQDLHDRLDRVNQWLADRPTMFPDSSQVLLTGGEITEFRRAAKFTPVPHPTDGEVVLHDMQVAVPTRPSPPHRWMLVSAALTIIATLTTAFLAPGPDSDDQAAALGLAVVRHFLS